MEFRYILEPYKNLSSRKFCPKCGKKELTLYIDTTTGEPIHPTVGKCNRLNNCGYHYTPKQYFIDNNMFVETLPPQAARTPQAKPKAKPISYVNTEIFKASLKNYDNNNFIKFLIKTFGEDVTIDLIKKYYIGSSKHWNNSTVFYQIDNFGKVRAGKVILYNPETGNRIKKLFDHITWLHSLLKLSKPSQCLFGLHLIKDTTKTIAIVESEKTAIIASIYLPQFIWLASGGMQNLRPGLFEAIKNRKIILYPDLKCFDIWSEKAKTLGLTNYIVSDLLERKANEAEKLQGLDIADHLLKYDYKALIKESESEPEPQPEIIPTNKDFLTVSTHRRAKTTETICNDYLELEKYFNSISIPEYPIELNKGTTISNLSVFVKNHLETVKYQYHNKTYFPYLERLLQVKAILN